jgi:hypothetical protein
MPPRNSDSRWLRARDSGNEFEISDWRFQSREGPGFFESVQAYDFPPVRAVFNAFHPISQPQGLDFPPVTTKAPFI